MPSLREMVAEEPKRSEVIDDALTVLDAEVGDKSGLSGIAIKAAFKMVKGLKPGFVRKAVDHLLDDFLDGIEPIYAEALEKKEKPAEYLKSHRGRVAEALLAVTDKRADKADAGTLKKAYGKLRPTAKKHVESAAPRLAEMVERHLPV